MTKFNPSKENSIPGLVRIAGGPQPYDIKVSHVSNGAPINGITSISVELNPNTLATATISLFVTDLLIEAEPMLCLETIKQAAAHYGYKLTEVF